MAYLKERSVIRKEDDVSGRMRVTIDEYLLMLAAENLTSLASRREEMSGKFFPDISDPILLACITFFQNQENILSFVGFGPMRNILTSMIYIFIHRKR